MGGSPHSASERRPFAVASSPSTRMQSPAAGSTTSETALGFYGGCRTPRQALDMPSKALSVSPQPPFAFTPQPYSASSLSSGLHPLAQRPSPPTGSYGGQGARLSLAIRRPSWSLGSSLALSSLAGMSPAHDSTSSLAVSGGSSSQALIAAQQHSLLRSGASASSPDDDMAIDGEEQDPLPFALDGDAELFVEHAGRLPSVSSVQLNARCVRA